MGRRFLRFSRVGLERYRFFFVRFQADDKNDTSSKGGPGDKGPGDDEAAQREISALKVWEE